MSKARRTIQALGAADEHMKQAARELSGADVDALSKGAGLTDAEAASGRLIAKRLEGTRRKLREYRDALRRRAV